MGLARLLSESDPAFKGQKPHAVKAADSNIYKYIVGRYSSQADASLKLQSVRKAFPAAFLVKVDGNSVTRVK